MKKLLTICSVLALAVLLLAACSAGSQPTTGPAPTATVPTGSDPSGNPISADPQEPSPTPQPSPTPEVGRVLLIAPDGSAGELQALLAELSQPAGLVLEMRPALQPGELNPSVKVVVLAEPPVNLAELLRAAPQAQFVTFSSTSEPQPAGNLSVIRHPAEYQAFMAGYLSTLLSHDYRAAGLLPGDGALGPQLKEAYQNGGRYFCGVCAPGWPLIYYPLVAELPASSDGAAWQQAAAGLFDQQKVEVFYVSREAMRPEVIDYLKGRVQFNSTVLVLGEQPAPDALREQWAATLGFDNAAALRSLWPDLLAGRGGLATQAPLALSQVNTQVFGVGRQRLAAELLEEIGAGRIYPFTVPAQ